MESTSVGNRLVYCNVRLSYNLACTAIGTASKSIKNANSLREHLFARIVYKNIKVLVWLTIYISGFCPLSEFPNKTTLSSFGWKESDMKIE